MDSRQSNRLYSLRNKIPKMTYYIQGGIGDAILCLDDAIKKQKCDLYTCQEGVKEFLNDFGVRVEKMIVYSSVEESMKITPKGQSLEKSPYFSQRHKVSKFSPLSGVDDFHNEKPILGIHPFGSKLSNDFREDRHQPIKSISEDSMTYMINWLHPHYNIIVFGARSELDNFTQNYAGYRDLRFSYCTIAEAYALVELCSSVIATDSAIKTMAASLKIPSFVYIGNYVDTYRDEVFLRPYINDKIMYVEENVTRWIISPHSFRKDTRVYDYAIKTLVEQAKKKCWTLY